MTTTPGELTGFTVGITADRRWAEQAALFERRGAAVIHGPTITTLPLGAETPLRQVTDYVIARPPAVLIANTGVGIRSWLGHADAWGIGLELMAALDGTRIYARGPKASGAVHSAGLEVVARAGSEQLGEIVDLVAKTINPGERVVVQLDGSGQSPALERLDQAGAEVVALPVYRWTLPEDNGPALRLAEAVIAGGVQAVTFTTGPAISNWLTIAHRKGLAEELRRALTDGRAVVGSVGPVCTQMAESLGLASPHLVEPGAYRIGALVRAVAERLVGTRVTVRIGSSALTISGNAVLVDGSSIALSDTEARLLSILAAQPNTVFPKRLLLRKLWGGASTDPHVVEVGIARLRKRLGAHGRAVQSVHRRGYTFRG